MRRCYTAWNARDHATAKKALAPNVEWPDQFDGKTLVGPEAVAAYWQLRWMEFNPHKELIHFEVGKDGHLVLTLVQTLHLANGALISRGLVRHVFQFERGLIRRMWILL